MLCAVTIALIKKIERSFILFYYCDIANLEKCTYIAQTVIIQKLKYLRLYEISTCQNGLCWFY